MRLLRYLRRSLGMTQAAIVLAVALIIGLVMGVLQLGFVLEQEQHKVHNLTELLLTLSEGGQRMQPGIWIITSQEVSLQVSLPAKG